MHDALNKTDVAQTDAKQAIDNVMKDIETVNKIISEVSSFQ